tara:strand:- start:176 stop:478 length:303 start_codon:yes stop_codon:yes gene_type:complete
MAIDILLDGNDDVLFDDNGELILGETTLQEVGIIARLNKGDLKSDPLLGPNLIELINSNAPKSEIRQRLRLHLERDGKSLDDLEDLIELITKNDQGDAIN